MIPGAIDCVQGDSLWFKCRLGCVTSSRVADAVAKLKRSTNEAACRRDMRFELACERLTEKPAEHFVSVWMEEGKEKEPLARAEYELVRECYVEQLGFVYHPTIKLAGASPDGLVGEDGLIEIKCPKIETHFGYLIDNVVPEQYQPQMLWQMACTERTWCDFVSYHPDAPEPYKILIKRLHRDKENDAIIRGMELEVIQFLSEVDQMLVTLKENLCTTTSSEKYANSGSV